MNPVQNTHSRFFSKVESLIQGSPYKGRVLAPIIAGYKGAKTVITAYKKADACRKTVINVNAAAENAQKDGNIPVWNKKKILFLYMQQIGKTILSPFIGIARAVKTLFETLRDPIRNIQKYQNEQDLTSEAELTKNNIYQILLNDHEAISSEVLIKFSESFTKQFGIPLWDHSETSKKALRNLLGKKTDLFFKVLETSIYSNQLQLQKEEIIDQNTTENYIKNLLHTILLYNSEPIPSEILIKLTKSFNTQFSTSLWDNSDKSKKFLLFLIQKDLSFFSPQPKTLLLEKYFKKSSEFNTNTYYKDHIKARKFIIKHIPRELQKILKEEYKNILLK